MLGYNFLKRLFLPEYMIKPEQKMGDLISTKEVYQNLYKVAWPATLEAVLIGMVSFIDSIMVGTIGSYAIAAVGLTNQPRLIFFALFFALNIGVTAIVSRRRGQEDKAGANRCLGQAIMICILMGVVLCTVAVIFAEPLLLFAGAQSDTIESATIYFKITMVGTIFSSLGMIINGAQRGCGNTKISMRTNLIANLINIVFNYLLIGGNFGFPQLGIEGAAIATLMGNIVSCGMSIYSISKANNFLHIKIKDCFYWDKEVISLIVRVGGSAAVEQVFIRIGFFAYSKMVAELGTTDLTTHQICMNIINLSFTFGDGIGIAASSLVGQNLGRKRSDMSIIYGKVAQRVGFVISLILFGLFAFGGKMLVSMFTPETNIIEMGSVLLVWVAFTSPAQISQVIFTGCLRGAGDTKFVAYTSLISIALIRPILTYLLCYPLGVGLLGAWISLLVDQYLRLFFSLVRFSGGKWCKIKI